VISLIGDDLIGPLKEHTVELELHWMQKGSKTMSSSLQIGKSPLKEGLSNRHPFRRQM